MTIVSKRKFGFTSSSVYRRKEPHAFKYLSERATFWIAVLSVFAFVTGNMVGQHGWHVFWASVLGEGSDSMIVFTGMAPPIAQVPDYERWAKLGGDIRKNTYRQVPKDMLVSLPTYKRYGDDLTSDSGLRRVYFVEHLGTYETGRGKGSHVGEDISVPEGTPVLSVANGIIDSIGYQAGGYGHYVVVRHPNVPDVDRHGEKSTVFSVYAHLSAVLGQEGAVVQKGDQIALSGQSGFATAPHLHFQMDRASAPFHPYWPFSSQDQQSARMNFTQAIDAGLRRENGVQYTLDPMLTVQSYETYVGPVVADATSAAISSMSSSLRMTPAQRREQRMAKLAAAKPTLVAYTENAPVVPIPVPASSSAAPPVAAPAIGPVMSVRISHDGSFGKERAWENITLLLLDRDGKTVTAPTSSDIVYLRTAFGRAEFKPSAIAVSDFKNGVAKVQMLPLGDTTIIIQAQPTGEMSQPMRYIR
ncbi:M23 family metallopeptidase [Candidatus Peribacteria bacterium]|nr:M23 family metallopeptidase [Candidatus Peribacteria bacterium]